MSVFFVVSKSFYFDYIDIERVFTSDFRPADALAFVF